MQLPDGRPLILAAGVLAEPASPDGRLILWLPGATEGGYRHWDRVGNVARAAVHAEEGVRSTAATATRARQGLGSPLGRLFRGLGGSKSDRSWALPGGGTAEPCGERRADLVLAWSEDEAAPLDEARIRARWPARRDFRPIGPDLYLVSGVAPVQPAAGAGQGPPSQDDTPRRLAERALAAARGSGDRRRAVTALSDLGLVHLLEGDAPRAAALLEEALADARLLDDRPGEADALSNLALVDLALGRPDRAREALGPVLAHARSSGDRHAEKAALDRLGRAHLALGDPAAALACFERALGLAAAVGDRQHEADLLWAAAIRHAELGRRDRADAHAAAAVGLLHRLGRPQAAWYAHHLANYRSGDPGASLPSSRAPGAEPASTYSGGSIDTAALPARPAPPAAADGPGPLRMALTAAKSMAQFLGSGLKTAPPATAAARLATCATCEHHTGLRCRICGCFTSAKARLDHERCPAGKWPS